MTLPGRPVDIASQGPRIDASVDAALVIVAAAFLIALGWMIVALLRKRRSDDAAPASTPRPWRIAFLAAAFFVIADVPLLLLSAGGLRELWSVDARERDSRVVRVELLARQWGWESRLPGLDGAFATADDVVLVGELRVPAERTVVLELASVDVVHSLHVPNLRLQRDIIPGRVGRAWFMAASTGAFEITCTQFCGASHFQMVAPLRVMEGEEFDAWLAEASARAAREGALLPARGWGWAWQGGAP